MGSADVGYSYIATELREAVFTIRLARAPVNVLHGPMMLEIEDALKKAADTRDAHVVVITGHERRAFSAGVEIADHDRGHIDKLVEQVRSLLTKVEQCPLPTIAALNGLTLGGGLELALACDMMLCLPEAKIGLPEIKLASIAFPAILMLQGRLPPNRITEILVGGETIDGREAHRLGLVNELVASESFEADVMRFASKFTRLSRPVLQLMMRTLKQARGKSLETGFADAAKLYLSELMQLDDAVEGLVAHRERRPPSWKHR
jgi:cyclohexa-1,5-dienecarbonyl-CoA hydratase